MKLLVLAAAVTTLGACADPAAPAADAGDADRGDGGSGDGVDAPSAVDAPPVGDGPYDAARVMFSGHSLINRNTPAYVAQLAQAGGQAIAYEAQIGNGSTMSLRLSCPLNGEQADGSAPTFRVLDELARPGAYDTLVVTERHDIILTIAYEASTAMAKHFVDALAAGTPGARPFLYESWWNVEGGDAQAWRARVARERAAWACVASRVNLARAPGQPAMRVLPAATALSALVDEVLQGTVPGMTALDDVFADAVHLTPEATYYVALFAYAVIYERTPVGLPHALTPQHGGAPAMTDATAARLQELAWREAQAAIAETDEHLQSLAACEASLAAVCAQTPDTNTYTCGTALPAGYDAVDAPIPVIDDDWCMR